MEEGDRTGMTDLMEVSASNALRQRVEAFLYLEARLLDERRVHDWLQLCTSDIHYVIPTRRSVIYSRRSTYDRPVDDEFDGNYALVEDDRMQLELRIKRLDSGNAWAEDPPTRTTRLVSNVEVEPGAREDEHCVRSCVLMQRIRDDTSNTILIYRREDRLRETDEGLKLADRRVLLDNTVWPFRSLSLIL
jgi:biphenyl 2,3-dioxygenase subunit beta